MASHDGTPRTSTDPCKGCAERMNRRRAMINAGIGGLGLGLLPGVLVGQTDPASAPPREGDLLVGVSRKSLKSLRPEDITVGAPPTRVWPMVQAGNIVRSENRLNELLLIRLDPATLSAETRSICE